MRTIKNKLNSQRGASLTFALLLFLVCAVVGSAVLVAGTAAAGRMSRIAEMDQRYYSVNSAARLLIELMETDMIYYRVEEPAGGTQSYIFYNIDQDSEEETEVKITSPTLALEIAEQSLGISETKEWLSLSVSGTDADASLAVKIQETLSPNGDVVFAVSNVEGTDRYTITLYFMNVGGASSFKWKLYDIDSKMPSAS
ncbi:MAG: hypothetical protein II885_02740 [Oscillospiraceae bacterium]|nr:hypothetical protein [Oscillospiraceae bacterium]